MPQCLDDVSGRLAREGAHPCEELAARLERVLTGERVRQFEYRDRAAGAARATRTRGVETGARAGPNDEDSRAGDLEEHRGVGGIAAGQGPVARLSQDSTDVGEHIRRIVDTEDVATEYDSRVCRGGSSVERGDRLLLVGVQVEDAPELGNPQHIGDA